MLNCEKCLAKCKDCGKIICNVSTRCKSCVAKLPRPHRLKDKILVKSLHDWLRKNFEKPKLCQNCKKAPPYDIANISPKYNPKTYNRDFKNWRWLCRKCHMKMDKRILSFNKKRNEAIKRGKVKRNKKGQYV